MPNESDRTSVLIVDDHVMVAQAMAQALRSAGFEPVEHMPADGLDMDSVLKAAERFRTDVALVDLALGDRSGMPIIAALTSRGIRVVAFSGNANRLAAAEALEQGAAGFLDKAEDFQVIAQSLGRVAHGEDLVGPSERAVMLGELRKTRAEVAARSRGLDTLSPKERDVLRSLLAGKSPQEIAEEAVVSVRTVRSHIEAIRMKLGVKSQLAAVALAREVGWTGE